MEAHQDKIAYLVDRLERGPCVRWVCDIGRGIKQPDLSVENRRERQ